MVTLRFTDEEYNLLLDELHELQSYRYCDDKVHLDKSTSEALSIVEKAKSIDDRLVGR